MPGKPGSFVLLLVLLGWQQAAFGASESQCRRNPPGLQTSDMVSRGFVVHYTTGGDKEYVRLDYVYTDQLYYEHAGTTWRAIYLAHPSAVIQTGEEEATICGYVLGFPIRRVGSATGEIKWVFLPDVRFVETP